MTRTIRIFAAALLISLAAVSCLAKESSAVQAIQQQQPAPQSRHSLLASKLLPQQSKARSARSLSDMFERVKNRIFGKKASSQSASSSATSSAIQPAASVNSAQRQPWDLNSFNQQFSPYAGISTGNFQWPASSALGNQYSSQNFGSINGATNFPLTQVGSSNILGLDAISQAGGGQSGSVGQPNGQSSASSGSGNGLFSSASHLIAQYLSPSGNSASPSSNSLPAGSGMVMGQQQSSNVVGQQQPGQSMLTPQQQQQQSQYQEFASILDSMVAQTGASNNPRQPMTAQYGIQAQSSIQPQGQQQPQQQQPQSAGYPGSQSAIGGQGSSMIGSDNDMSSSSNVQSYVPAATQQQASQKSSMVSLAEQIAPGAQFNKLISFPFSLSANDDPSKEGRYKLHIPFLNQHVKRSDSSASSTANQKAYQQQQQQMQQYLSQYYSQLQQQQPSYQTQTRDAVPQQSQQQLAAMASQAVPSIVSPSQSSVASSSSQSSSGAVSSAQQSPASSSSAAASPSSNQSVSSSVSSSSSSPSSSVSANQRPNWSVADTQSSSASSSSKLIPIQSAAAAPSPVEVVAQN